MVCSEEMDTTITISSKGAKNKSDFLQLTYNARKNKDAIISLDSSNFGQSGTVTWDQKCPTLSNIEKVTNWMKQSDKECVKSDFKDLVKNNESETKSLILVQCDFNKSTNAESFYPSPFNRSTSLINYFKDESLALSKKSKVYMNPKGNKIRASELQSNYFHLEKETTFSPFSKKDPSESMDDIPSSPESRKKELCHYLQLMNPADKKEIIILQNRRSTRVRNLTEQKQFQEKLKEINEENSKEICDSSEKSDTLKSFKELNIQICKNNSEQVSIKSDFLFPFPPRELNSIKEDFDDVMSDLVPKLKRRCKDMKLPWLTKRKKYSLEHNQVQTNGKNKFKMHKRQSRGRIKSLRSNGNLKSIPIEKLIDRNNKKLMKVKYSKSNFDKQEDRKLDTPSSVMSRKRSKSVGSLCEIISVDLNQEDLDLEHIMDDVVDFDKLSEEHKKCLIESRILSTNKNISHNKETSPLFGFTKSDTQEITQMCERYKKSLQVCLNNVVPNESKSFKESEQKPTDHSGIIGGNTYLIVNIHRSDSENISGSSVSEPSTTSSLHDHDYASVPCKNIDREDSDSDDSNSIPQNKNGVLGNFIEEELQNISSNKTFEPVPYKENMNKQSLHKSLQFSKTKRRKLVSIVPDWDIHSSPREQQKKQSHYINIDSENGVVLKAFYIDFNLIICQEYLISFYMQTPLGNVLGSQNMWVPRGQTQRIVLNNRCIQKDSMTKVVCTNTSIVFIELWMKEHKSEKREGPVADVFVTLYYWQQSVTGLNKKVLQLENINGFADDVQYCVMKSIPKIIVSWHSTNEDNTQFRKTYIHAYQLAFDFQTVSNIYNIEPVDHYVSSLHNLEDYEDLIMGCGENKITLWNVEFGRIIATVELNDIKTPLSTLWVRGDRGFLFALQQCVDRELRLIAINGINKSWKKLASYYPPEGFDRLKGVCIENGLLISVYDQGILCWNTETGEPVEEINGDNDILVSGTHIILVEDNQIIVKHALTHLMSMPIDDS